MSDNFLDERDPEAEMWTRRFAVGGIALAMGVAVYALPFAPWHRHADDGYPKSEATAAGAVVEALAAPDSGAMKALIVNPVLWSRWCRNSAGKQLHYGKSQNGILDGQVEAAWEACGQTAAWVAPTVTRVELGEGRDVSLCEEKLRSFSMTIEATADGKPAFVDVPWAVLGPSESGDRIVVLRSAPTCRTEAR